MALFDVNVKLHLQEQATSLAMNRTLQGEVNFSQSATKRILPTSD
jgi:hypothetical protein